MHQVAWSLIRWNQWTKRGLGSLENSAIGSWKFVQKVVSRHYSRTCEWVIVARSEKNVSVGCHSDRFESKCSEHAAKAEQAFFIIVGFTNKQARLEFSE